MTVLVRAISSPFYLFYRTQMAMQAVQPELAEINENTKMIPWKKGVARWKCNHVNRIRPFTTMLPRSCSSLIFSRSRTPFSVSDFQRFV